MIEIIHPGNGSFRQANLAAQPDANQASRFAAELRGAMGDPASRASEGFHPSSRLRQAFLTSIRAQIEGGVYETPERLAGTVDRLLDLLA